jgi:hypothetical protein
MIWITKGKEVKLESLSKLLTLLIEIPDSEIDIQMGENMANLRKWLEKEFSDNLTLMAHLQENFTLQQFREMLIRDLRMIISSA